jgi:hypothetical protein
MHNAAPSDRSAARTTRPIAPASRRAARRRCSACNKTCRVSRRVARQRCAPSKPGDAQSGVRPRCAGRIRPGRLNGQAGRRDRRSASGLQSTSGSESGGKRPGQKAEQCASGRDTKRVPQRLSAKLRRRAARGRRGIELPGKEQGESLGKLPESGWRGWRRRSTCGRRCCGARSGRRSDGCNDRRPRSGARRCAGAGAAADAAARSAVRPEVGLRRRRSRALRGRPTRRRPYHPMPGRAGSLPFTCMRGCSRAVRGAITKTSKFCRQPAAGYFLLAQSTGSN